MRRRFTMILGLWCFAAAMLCAGVDIESVLPDLGEGELRSLSEGTILSGSTIDGNTIVRLAPRNTMAYERSVQAQAKQEGFSVAALGYLPFPDFMKTMSSEERQLYLFNSIRAISTQEGITYISWRAGNKPKVLIEKSYYLADSVNLNKHLPDPVATVLPETAESYVFQRDTTFKGNRYHHAYRTNDREIFLEIDNISAMRVFGLFTAVPAGKLSICMETYQTDDGVLLYAFTSIADREPTVKILGYSVDLPSAFMRRIRALQEWLVAEIQEDEGKEGV